MELDANVGHENVAKIDRDHLDVKVELPWLWLIVKLVPAVQVKSGLWMRDDLTSESICTILAIADTSC